MPQKVPKSVTQKVPRMVVLLLWVTQKVPKMVAILLWVAEKVSHRVTRTKL